MQRPHVTVHVAQSLDGRLAFAGATTSLSTAEGRRAAHVERAAHDAVLVGAATVRIDDPRLTVRHAPGEDPMRVVLASALDVPRGARFLASGRVLVVGAEGRAEPSHRSWLASRGVDAEVVGANDEGLVDLREALDVLAARGVRRLLVEGGGRVVTSFLRARLVDRLHVEIAMRILGAKGTPTVGVLGVGALGETPALANVSIERCGDNLLVRGDVVHG